MDTKQFLEGQAKIEDERLQNLKESIIDTSIKLMNTPNIDFKNQSIYLNNLGEDIFILEHEYGKETDISIPDHYSGSVDVISFIEKNSEYSEFNACLIFNIIKYTTRLGRKDEEVKEISKIKNYYLRLKNHIVVGNSLG